MLTFIKANKADFATLMPHLLSKMEQWASDAGDSQLQQDVNQRGLC